MVKLSDGLLKGSLILLVSFGLFNVFNFLVQFSMARMLSLEDFGIFASLMAIVYVLAVFVESIQTVVVKYSSKSVSDGKVKNLFKRSMKKSFRTSLIIFAIYLIFSLILSELLQIDYYLLALNGVIIFASFLIPISRGILQGRKRFVSLGANMVSESFSRLILSILFVFMGLKVFGAVLGTIMGFAISFGFSFLQLKKILKSDEEKHKAPQIKNFGQSAVLVNLLIIAFYSIDIVIAKMMFNEIVAGTYAVASVLSKAVFWGTLPISKSMLPLSAENANKKKENNKILLNSFLMVFSLIFVALLVFGLFPDLIINIFSGKIIPEASEILIYLGISTSLISISNLLLIHKLSIGKTKGYKMLFIFLALEIILMIYFAQNLIQFSFAYVFSSLALLWGVLYILK